MMRKLFFIPLLFVLASLAGQNKIVLNSNSLRISDTTGKWVYTVYARHDSIFYGKGGNENFVVKVNTSGVDSASYHTLTQLTDSSFKLCRPNGTCDTIVFVSGASVDTLYRTIGKDSLQFYISGRYHAILDSTISANQTIGTIGDSENGQGTIISTGSKGFITIPYNCTITNWYVSANLAGTIQFDLKRSSTSIIGTGNKPALSTQLSANAGVSGWTSVTVTAGDILEWVVDASPAPAVLTQCVVVLKVIK